MFRVKRKIKAPDLAIHLRLVVSFEYLLNGKRHREDGPALELVNGSEYYYLNDKLLLYPKWKQKCLELKLNFSYIQNGNKNV